jgi:hypothetical protein
MNRALLVGINAYPGAPLAGCVNDIRDMADFLNQKCAFPRDNVRLLVDGRATTKGILERLAWLLNGLSAGDRVLFHYSGHGAQLPTRNPKGEVDGLDEVICPVDFDWSDEHVIRDKDFNKLFSPVPAGVEFIWVSDSCHSGDLTRALPPPGRDHERSKTLLPPADIDWRLQTAKELRIDALCMARAAKGLHVALVSGCRSDQTSSDAVFGGRPNGALTYFLLSELKKADGLTVPLKAVVEHVQSALQRAHFTQVPQLGGSPEIAARAFLVGVLKQQA